MQSFIVTVFKRTKNSIWFHSHAHGLKQIIHLEPPPLPKNLPDIVLSSDVSDGNAHTYQWRVSYFTYPSPNNACHRVYSR